MQWVALACAGAVQYSEQLLSVLQFLDRRRLMTSSAAHEPLLQWFYNRYKGRPFPLAMSGITWLCVSCMQLRACATSGYLSVRHAASQILKCAATMIR